MPPTPRSNAAPAESPTPNTSPAIATADSLEPRILQVVATRTGFYAHMRRRPGDAFTLTLRPEQKLPSWVKEVGAGATASAPDPAPAGSAASAPTPSASVI